MDGVSVRGLYVERGGRLVLRGASLEAPRGSVTVVLGPNGAGKTTLLEAVAGAVRPRAGEILVGGRLVYSGSRGVELPPEERRAALVPQDHALFPHMTVYENIALGPRARGLPPGEVRRLVHWAAGLVGVDSLLDRRPGELSGGQRQRVAIARALAAEPEALLLDEPFSALDPVARKRMRRLLPRLARETGVAAVMVTHSFSDAWATGSRIYILEDGVARGGASPRELATRPLRHGAAEVLGYNLLEARATGDPYTVEARGLGPLRLAEPHGAATGAPVLVAVRPDDVVVPAPPTASVNVYTVRILEAVVTRYGVRLVLEAAGGAVLEAEAGRGQLHAALGHIPREGEQLAIHIPPGLVDAEPLYGASRSASPARRVGLG